MAASRDALPTATGPGRDVPADPTDLTGYLLEDALTVLEQSGHRVQVQETVPPVMHKSKAKQIPMAFGAQRVLRQRLLPATAATASETEKGIVELVVAREQLAAPTLTEAALTEAAPDCN